MGIRDIIEQHRMRVQKHKKIIETRRRLDIQREKEELAQMKKIRKEKEELAKLKKEKRDLKFAGLKKFTNKPVRTKPVKRKKHRIKNRKQPVKRKKLRIKNIKQPKIIDNTNNPFFMQDTKENPFTSKKKEEKNIWQL